MSALADDLDRKNRYRDQAPGPLIVVSMWRSGGSLLYTLLNKHPQVALTYEADLILLRSAFWKPALRSDWAARWEFYNQAFTRHGLSADEFSSQAFDFWTAFATAHQEYARRKGAAIWGDKSPSYYDQLNEIAEEFPDARFVILWRDPVGTANAIARAAALQDGFFRRRGAKLRGLLGYHALKKEVDRLLAGGSAVCQISYEDLTGDPAAAMQKVCGFLQIPYTDDLANLQGADRSAIHPGEQHAFIRGNKIVSGPRPQALSAEFRQKVLQYVALWRRQYAGVWPPFPAINVDSIEAPGLFQRLSENLAYRTLRAFDSCKGFAFCFAPLSLLARYRTWRYGENTAQNSLWRWVVSALRDKVD